MDYNIAACQFQCACKAVLVGARVATNYDGTKHKGIILCASLYTRVSGGWTLYNNGRQIHGIAGYIMYVSLKVIMRSKKWNNLQPFLVLLSLYRK